MQVPIACGNELVAKTQIPDRSARWLLLWFFKFNAKRTTFTLPSVSYQKKKNFGRIQNYHWPRRLSWSQSRYSFGKLKKKTFRPSNVQNSTAFSSTHLNLNISSTCRLLRLSTSSIGLLVSSSSSLLPHHWNYLFLNPIPCNLDLSCTGSFATRAVSRRKPHTDLIVILLPTKIIISGYNIIIGFTVRGVGEIVYLIIPR